MSLKENNLLSFEELSSQKREKVTLPLKRVILKETNSMNTTEYQNNQNYDVVK